MLSSLIGSSKKGTPCKGSDSEHQSVLDAGLRLILTKLAKRNSNIVIKRISLFSSSTTSCNGDDDQFCCYLKSCHLCKKPLSLDKEIYMYRGDMGFCSEECREEQIYMDEVKEIETATQQRLASYRRQRCRDRSGRFEIDAGLEAFHRRRQRFPSQKNRVIFS